MGTAIGGAAGAFLGLITGPGAAASGAAGASLVGNVGAAGAAIAWQIYTNGVCNRECDEQSC